MSENRNRFKWHKVIHIINLFKYFAGSLSSSPFLTSGTSLHQHMTVMKCWQTTSTSVAKIQQI